MSDDLDTTASGLPLAATPLFAPWWAKNVPESEDDHTCTRCGGSVAINFDVEWFGPLDNYHLNLCNGCAHELVFEMWERLESVANVVTTDHESKDAFIGRVRAVLWANTELTGASPVQREFAE